MDLLYKEEVYQVIGSAIEVHRVLGHGFLESVYHEALKIELQTRGIPFTTEKSVEVFYKGKPLPKTFFMDLVCFENIVVELKAASSLTGKDDAQLLHYLKATNFPLGLLVNFGSHPRLEWKRFIL